VFVDLAAVAVVAAVEFASGVDDLQNHWVVPGQAQEAFRCAFVVELVAFGRGQVHIPEAE